MLLCLDKPKIGKYGTSVKTFEDNLVMKPLTGQRIVIDEIGRMQMMSKKFKNWINTIVESNNDLLATIPCIDSIDKNNMTQEEINYIEKISKNCLVLSLDENNRNKILDQLLQYYHI